MAPSNIQIPDDVIRITSPRSGRTIFMTKKAERVLLESDDRKAKLESRALRRAEAGLNSQKELEKTEGAVTVGEFLLRKVAAEENSLKYFSREATSKVQLISKEAEPNFEKMKQETVEALKLMYRQLKHLIGKEEK